MNKEQRWIALKVVHPALRGAVMRSRVVKCLTKSGKTVRAYCLKVGKTLHWVSPQEIAVEEKITHWKPF